MYPSKLFVLKQNSGIRSYLTCDFLYCIFSSDWITFVISNSIFNQLKLMKSSNPVLQCTIFVAISKLTLLSTI